MSQYFWRALYLPRPFSKQFILKAVSIVLKENTFEFNGKHYRQLQGTAMGTKMAPTYATLVMGYLEKRLYQKFEEKYGSMEREKIIKTFKRFLDDCFLFWWKSRRQLEELFEMLNSLHPKIKFTMETSDKKLPFLDILLRKEKAQIHTDIFYKETDSHQYLNFNSCHPKHCKSNIPYALARRICTIVNDSKLQEHRLQELKTFLTRQNYPMTLIEQGIKRAKQLTIQELRKPKTVQRESKVLPLVITHNPNNAQIIGTVRESIKFLNNYGSLKNTLKNTKLIVSRRQPKNLKRILTKAKFSSEDETATVKKCGESRCGTCPLIITGDTINFYNGKTWTVKSNMNCKTKNVIYVIICTKCKSFYVGTTENLRKRVTLHKEQIKHAEYRHLAVSEHLHKCNDDNFNIMPIYHCESSNRLLRETKEKYLITILKPNLNME